MVPSKVAGSALPAWCVEPYQSSFIDAAQTWIDRRPWPWWLSYVVAALAVVSLVTAHKWRAGIYPAGTVFPLHIVIFSTGIYSLALMHFLDRTAARALDVMRPALTLSEPEVARVRFLFTHMPQRGVWLALAAGAGFALLQRILIVAPQIEKYRYATSGPMYAFELAFVVLVNFPLIFLFFFHAVRHLRLVDELYRHHSRIDLFHTRPLYAFSSVSARTAIGLLIAGYAWVQTFPRDVTAPVIGVLVGIEGAIVLLVLLTFVWPLWGAHIGLVEERHRRKQEAHEKLDAALEKLHGCIADGDYAQVDGINKAITSVVEELRLIQAASTWPWSPTTLRAFLTAVFLPMFLWATQQVLSRTLLA